MVQILYLIVPIELLGKNSTKSTIWGHTMEVSDLSKIQSSCESCVDTEEILQNVVFLQKSYGSISSLHALYLDTIKDIQIHLIEQLKNNYFEDASFVTNTTANFVHEIIRDLQCTSKSRISKLIAEFYLKYPECDKQIISSKLGMMMSYSFIVDQMSQLEDGLRANAMVKAGKTCFTKNDKRLIISTLTSIIYQHTRVPLIPKNRIFYPLDKISEKLIKLGIKYISNRHIEKSISISKSLIHRERVK